MAPERPDLILSSDIPHVELDVLVRDRLDVEADGRDGGDALVELQFVKYCCERVRCQFEALGMKNNISTRRGEGEGRAYSSCQPHPSPT